MNNNWYKKEKPLLGLTGLGGGVDGLSVVGAASKVYVDDVFSTYVYNGNESARNITNNVDLTKGGLVWVKSRNDTHDHQLADTVRGANQIMSSDANTADATLSNRITAFNSDGFTLGSAGQVNGTNAYNYSSWTFRKQKGFCDIVTYTGNDSARTISHGLGCIPGLIMIKCTSTANSWYVYHRDLGETKYLMLNHDNAAATQTWFMNDTAPTSSVFSLGTSANVNGSGETYVAYLFAGGKSTAATAASNSFNGTSGLNIAASSDISFGTGTFCIEGWVYVDNLAGPGYGRFFQLDGPSGNNDIKNLQVTLRPSDNTVHAWSYDGSTTNVSISGSISLLKGWHHIAVVRTSDNTITQYVDGTPDGTATNITTDFSPNSGSPRPAIGHYPVDPTGGFTFDGKISNLRVTVGEPVYTGGFRPSTEPLTTTSQVTSSSNVKLLCCNSSSSATASTVTPGTISNNGTNPTAYGNNPFDDPDGFKFGGDSDNLEGIVKCGSYEGNSVNDGPEIFLGWEPQYILIKDADRTEDWILFDSMRGIVDGNSDRFLYPNTSGAEAGNNLIKLTPTGFKIVLASDEINYDGAEDTYIYMAIRRPDGYIGKPPELGTDVFAMDVGNGSGSGGSIATPSLDSGFPVDFAIVKRVASVSNWDASARLVQREYVRTNSSIASQDSDGYYFDSNVGWGQQSWLDSSVHSWMWKRGQGMDVVTWQGNGATSRFIPHNLNSVPEMIWLKTRTDATGWFIGHKGYNGGSNPFGGGHYSQFDTGVPTNDTIVWNAAPTSTHFNVGSYSGVNGSGKDLIAMLFASVDGISKVGSYTGSSDPITVTTGFQPRFVWIKNASVGSQYTNYYVLDTSRGWAAGDDKYLEMNDSQAEADFDFGYPTSTGFYLTGNSESYNQSGNTFIYYAHA